MGFFLVLLCSLVILLNSYMAQRQTAEEMLETLRVVFSQTANLNGITIPNITYDNFDPIDIIGPQEITTYDFVIVGAGTAGTVLANRLSEIPWFNVLLIEAGGEGDFLTDIPALGGLNQFTKYNWGYSTEIQENIALGLKDQRNLWSRGRGLGGSSLLNFMVHVRGNRLDYDRWAAMGNPGWSYEDVLPYFQISEDCRIRFADIPYRNYGGELTVEDVAYRSTSAHAFIQACLSLGYPYIDYNGAQQLGVSYAQATTRDGLRCSGEKAFLRPAKHRPNLTIRTNSFVTKILIDGRNSAYGVEFVRKGIKYRTIASKEVIVSAGSINSPQLLMLSGIGPKNHLKELGILVKKDLPVGQKLYDHFLYTSLVYKVNNQSIDIDVPSWSDPISFVELHKFGTGSLTSNGGLEALAFIKTNESTHPHSSYPDIELIFIGLALNSDNGVGLARLFNVKDEIYDVLFRPLEGQPTITVFPMLLHPKSYGYVKLRSSNPFDYPKLYANYLSDPGNEDVKTLIAGIRETQRILKTPAFQIYGTEEVTTVVPGCEYYEYDSDPYWECALRTLGTTVFHQTTTCKMGPVTDPEAVVDERLRVHGIGKLRVIDASVIPTTLSAHTNVPTFMVGEKGADIIKQDWLKFL